MRVDLRDPKNRPADLAERFQPGKYDVYILLGDIDATAFQGDELANLAKCVSRGAGLMMLGGFQSFGPGGYGQTPLANVLPVGMDRLERQQPDEPLRTDLHWPGPLRMQPTAMGLRHFALLLAGNRQENAALWAEAAAAGRGQQVPRPGPRRRSAGRRRLGQAAAGGPQFRRRPRAGLRRRFHLALVDAGIRVGLQALLAASRPLAGAKGPVAGGQRLDPAARSAALRRRSGWSSPSGPTRPPANRSAMPPSRPRSCCRTAPAVPCRWLRQAEQMAGSFRDTQTPGDYAIEVSATHKDQPLGGTRARFLVFQQDLELDNAAADAAYAGEPGRHDRRAVAGPRAVARTDETPHGANAIARSAARDEENLLGHVVVLPHARRAAGAGVVFAEALGAGVKGERPICHTSGDRIRSRPTSAVMIAPDASSVS